MSQLITSQKKLILGFQGLICLFVVVSGNKLLLECPAADKSPVITVIKGSVDLARSGEVEQSDESWESYRPMLIKCKAPYPITWDFAGFKPPDLSVETVVEVDNVLNPVQRCYFSNLKVLASGYTGKESRTGNYTCKSLDGIKQSSVYRFAHDGTSLFNTRKTMEAKVFMKGSVAQVYIPCTANIANLNASILRIQENATFVPLDSSIEQRYDAKKGFLLTSPKNSSALVGKFVCSGTYKNETEIVEITVSPATDFIVSPTKNHLTFRNNRISVSCKSYEQVEMKFTNTNVQVQHHVREITYKTDGYKYGAMADIFTHPSQDVLRGEISCVKKASQEVLFTWKYDTDYACRCNWTLKPDLFKTTRFFFLLDRTLRGTIRAFGLNTEGDSYYMNLPTPRGELSCTSPHSKKVNLTFIPCENLIECQIKSGFLNWFDFDNRAYTESAFSDEEGDELANQTTISQGYIRSGLIKCGVEDYITTQIAIANLDTLYIDSIPSKNLVRIIAPESNVFVGDKMLFTCLYEKFQIAREAKFAFQYRNGTIDFVEIVDRQDDRYSFDLEKYQRSAYIKIASPDIISLMCFVPVWNSTVWKNTTFALNVSNAVPVEKESPLNCPTDSSPIIILQRNSTVSSRRLRIPHLVSNSTISLFNPVNEIQLICRANYPVQWVYNDEPQNTSKIGKVPCSNSATLKKVYEAVLNIDPLKKEGTGNYTCRKTFAFVPQSYVYIYAVGDGDATFVNEGRHMQVVKHTDDPNQKVTLPCQVSNPESKPYLFLDHEDSQEKIQRLELNNMLQYDPRIGFEMDLSYAPEPITTFICSMSENASSFGVLITLRKQDGIFAAGASSGYQEAHGGNGMLIGITVILILLVILLSTGLLFMYKKCQDATTKTADVSQMGNTTGFSSYDDVRIQSDDRENIVDGNYNRFN